MKLRLILTLLSLLISGTSFKVAAQIADIDESHAEFQAVPAMVRPQDGKFPDRHVVLIRSGCLSDDAKTHLPSGTVDFSIAGSGTFKISGQGHDECSAWFDLSVSAADRGISVIKVLFAGQSKGTAFLHFGDSTMRPVPTVPQVDVMWSPISYKICSKAFGRSVAKTFWCIGLAIGNNSGYQLQIAGVGFKGRKGLRDENQTTPNSSYALTRAVAQDGASSSVRGYFINSVSATSLLMAGFSPYFHATGSVARYTTATSIVGGPLESALSLLWPDNSFRKANNLDDQSLRDGRLIPNNTQIKTVVFLDKGSATPDYFGACKALFKSTYDPSGTVPFAGLTPEGIKAKIAASSKQDAKSFDDCWRGYSTEGLKAALGDLVLVGDTVKFMERIVVDQTVQSQEASTGAQATASTVEYDKLTIAAVHPDQLPASLKVVANNVHADATRSNVGSTPATYTLSSVLPSDATFSVTDSSGALRLPSGTVKNPPISITAATINGKSLSLAGSKLLLLPEKLKITYSQGSTAKFADGSLKKETLNDDTATYDLSDTLPTGTSFVLEESKPDHFPKTAGTAPSK